MFGIIKLMNKKDFYKKIYDSYGFITRARGTFLYTKKGVRLTDLYQEDGRAILGWEGGSAFTFLKNYLSKGLTGSFICEDHSRLTKAMETLLFSERTLFFFSTKQDAVQAGLYFSPENLSVYKPWNPCEVKFCDVDSVIFTPTLPWTDTIFILAVKSEIAQKADLNNLPVKDISVPFALQAAITKSIYNLIKELQIREEKDWFIYDTVISKYWQRNGAYLYSKVPENKYDEFVEHCLNCQLVINPDFKYPSIVPYGADKGVFTKLKNNPFDF